MPCLNYRAAVTLPYKECDYTVRLIAKIDAKINSQLPQSGSLDQDQGARQMRISHFVSTLRSDLKMKFGALLMPSHLPERSMRDDQRWNLNDPEQLDALGFEKGQIEVYFTAARRLCSAPELRDQVLVGIIP